MHINTTTWFCFMVSLIRLGYFISTHQFSDQWFLRGWKHAKKESFWTHLDTKCSVKISFDLISWWLCQHIIYFWHSCLWIKIRFWNMSKKIIFAQLHIGMPCTIFIYILLHELQRMLLKQPARVNICLNICFKLLSTCSNNQVYNTNHNL